MIYFITVGITCCESTFEWSCSNAVSDSDSTIAYIPDIDVDPNTLRSTEDTSAATVIIYPVSSNSLDCNGIVTRVEYCYNKVGASMTNIFTLLILRENADMFRITRVMLIPRPPSTDETCIGMICCGSHNFTSVEQFELPISNFAFGVIDPMGGHLLGFHSTRTEFQTLQYHITTSSLSLNVNATITKSVSSKLEDRTLRIMRFVVGKCLPLFKSHYLLEISSNGLTTACRS